MTEDQYEICRNCGGGKCMACALKRWHKKHAEDCPECCNPELFDVEEYRPEEQNGNRF